MRLTPFTVALFLAGSAVAADEAAVGLEVIPLRYRQAAELVPTLLPLVDGRGAVMGSGDQLLVRATPDAVRDVRAMVSMLDVMPRAVRIEVRQVFTRRGPGAPPAAAVAAGRAPVGPRGVPFSGFSNGEQVAMGRETRETAVRVRRDQGTGKQLARTVDGEEPAIVDDWYFATLGSDLRLLPRLLEGDRVSLEVVTRHASTSGDTELRTAVEGALGDWIDITRALEDHAWRRSGPEQQRLMEQRTDNAVLVRVQRVRAADEAP